MLNSSFDSFQDHNRSFSLLALVPPCIPLVAISIILFSMLVALRRATNWRKAVCPSMHSTCVPFNHSVLNACAIEACHELEEGGLSSMHYTCVPFNHRFSMLVALRCATRWREVVLERDGVVLFENLKGQLIVMQILKES